MGTDSIDLDVNIIVTVSLAAITKLQYARKELTLFKSRSALYSPENCTFVLVAFEGNTTPAQLIICLFLIKVFNKVVMVFASLCREMDQLKHEV